MGDAQKSHRGSARKEYPKSHKRVFQDLEALPRLIRIGFADRLFCHMVRTNNQSHQVIAARRLLDKNERAHGISFEYGHLEKKELRASCLLVLDRKAQGLRLVFRLQAGFRSVRESHERLERVQA